MKVIEEKNLPYPGFNKCVRDEERCYRLLDIAGTLVFEKSSRNQESLQHQAAILRRLTGIKGIPELVSLTGEPQNEIFRLRTKHIPGNLLSEVACELPVAALFRNCCQIFKVLEEIHKRGVVHGDVRPWNIICADDRAWLIDFEESRTFCLLPGPIRAYRERRSTENEVYWVLRDLKDLISTVLFCFSKSRSLIPRWISMVSPALVRRFNLPPLGHGVLQSTCQRRTGPEDRNR